MQQAQGAALSVTQTALAVVGGIIGSSLITVAAFFLILRYRRKKRAGANSRGAKIGYPDLKGSSSNATGGGRIGNGYISDDAESIYSTDANGFRPDIKTPMPVAVRTSLNDPPKNGRGTPGIGYAVSFYAPKDGTNASGNNTNMSGTTAGGFQLSDPPKKQFTLFPKSTVDLTTPSTGMSSQSDGRGTPQATLQRTSKGFVTNLDAWIRAGTVSPFGTLKKGQDANGGKR